MLISGMIVALLGIIFLLLFVAIEWTLQWLVQRKTLRARLKGGNKHTPSVQRPSSSTKLMLSVMKHLEQLLHSLQIPLKGNQLFSTLLGLFIGGMLLGSWLLGTWKGALLLGAMIAALPYLVLRFILVHRRLEAQIDFLPALESFYQCYLITGERQIKVALARLIEEKVMTGAMKRIFEQLYRNLSVLEDDDESLELFAHALGHLWADYFVQMLKVAMSEGVSISGSLKELISDMRAARRANEQERHRLLEIRIANFTPLLFLALFVGINVYYNREQSIQYYVHDPNGREMLLHMFVMIFLSFLMGLYLSRKKLND